MEDNIHTWMITGNLKTLSEMEESVPSYVSFKKKSDTKLIMDLEKANFSWRYMAEMFPAELLLPTCHLGATIEIKWV